MQPSITGNAKLEQVPGGEINDSIPVTKDPEPSISLLCLPQGQVYSRPGSLIVTGSSQGSMLPYSSSEQWAVFWHHPRNLRKALFPEDSRNISLTLSGVNPVLIPERINETSNQGIYLVMY